MSRIFTKVFRVFTRRPTAIACPRNKGLHLIVLSLGMCGALLSASAVQAQRASVIVPHGDTPAIDLAVNYVASRSLKANSGQNFWFQGGSIELGANAFRGWGIAANVTGTHARSIGNSGIPISIVAATFGPRYRWHAGHPYSVYGEGLVGEANGFKSLFPVPGAAQNSANGLATQVGGGVDFSLSRRFSARLLQVSWLRTQLPNATDNAQNTLNLGAGFVLKF